MSLFHNPVNPYGPRMTAMMAYFGIDPTDRKYQGVRAQTGGWCDFCALHSVSNPRPRCDLEQARAKELEAIGYEVAVCFRCKCAYPKKFAHAALCPPCHQRQVEGDRIVLERTKKDRTSNSHGSSSVRVPDGLGCTERVPRWTVDWDGNPNG